MPKLIAQLPTRRAWVDFQIEKPDEKGNNAKRIDGLNVRFNISKTRGQVQGRARISICNLGRRDLEYLTTYMSPWVELQKRKKIQLFAGYEGNTALLFSGDILKALPTQPPDVWLECEALGGYYNNLITESFTLQGPITLKQIAQTLAKRQGLLFSCKADATVANQQVDNFCHTGGLTNSLKKLNELGLCVAWIEDGTLCLDAKEPEFKEGANMRVISEDSGLVGVPVPGPLGVDVTVLLDPSLKLGEPVEIRSSLMPSINGVYWPYSLEHTGELRGNEWYTKLKCQRFQYA